MNIPKVAILAFAGFYVFSALFTMNCTKMKMVGDKLEITATRFDGSIRWKRKYLWDGETFTRVAHTPHLTG